MLKIGGKIRQLREEQGLSLRALAERAGVSASALSQIEAGQNSPSIATLEKICAALKVAITTLFDEGETEEAPLIMRAGVRRKVYSAGSHTSIEPLARGLARKKMRPLLMVLEVGGECGEHPYASAAGEEFAMVIEGAARFEQKGTINELQTNDAIYYDPSVPHNWRNAGSGPLTLLVVVAQ